MDTRPYVKGTSYALPPESVSYFFTARDEFHTEALFKTDLSINLSRQVGRGTEVFAQFYVFNVFNQENYGSYTTTFSSGANFGKPSFNSSMAYQARSLQLGVHFTF